MVLVVKNPAANAGDIRDLGSIPGWEDPLEESTAIHSSILAWRIPWTEETDGLQAIYTYIYINTHTHIYAVCMHAKLLQLRPTLCDPMDGLPLVHNRN